MIPAKQLKLVVPRSESVKYEAVQILINGLGLTKTAFFIRENLSNQGDYLEMKEKLFGDKTAADIYNEIKNIAK
ncbi:MAG: hypothetical protein ABFS56_13375 [Pseudomonadota bacterium]